MADFVKVAEAGDVPAGTGKCVEAGGKQIAIFNVDGTFHAIDNTCLHRGGPLGQGTLSGKAVTCPWHGWQYDVTSGKVTQNPAVGVACYTLEVRGDDIWADLPVSH